MRASSDPAALVPGMSTPDPRKPAPPRSRPAPGLRGRARRLLDILGSGSRPANDQLALPAPDLVSPRPSSSLHEMNALAATYLHAWSVGDVASAKEIAGVCGSDELIAGLTVVGLSLNQVAAAHLGMSEIDAAAAGRDLAIASNLKALTAAPGEGSS